MRHVPSGIIITRVLAGAAIGSVKSVQLARTASCCSSFPGQRGLPLLGTFAVLLIVFVNYSFQIWAKIFFELCAYALESNC